MQRRVYTLMNKRSSQKNINHKLQKPKYGNYLRGYGENKKHYIPLKSKEKLEETILHIRRY